MRRRGFGSAVRSVVLMFALAIVLPAAASAATRPGVVLDSDGPVVPSTTTAPWSVVVSVDTGAEGIQCTGTIIDPTHILTAAHCMFDEDTNLEFSTSDMEVFAGLVSSSGLSSAQEQDVASVRVMPGYVSGGTDDTHDIAELTLTAPLVFNASVAPVALGQAGALNFLLL
jgi:V8-like Glu-specific endopeptidase